jgi:hypothetical protein
VLTAAPTSKIITSAAAGTVSNASAQFTQTRLRRLRWLSSPDGVLVSEAGSPVSWCCSFI